MRQRLASETARPPLPNNKRHAFLDMLKTVPATACSPSIAGKGGTPSAAEDCYATSKSKTLEDREARLLQLTLIQQQQLAAETPSGGGERLSAST